MVLSMHPSLMEPNFAPFFFSHSFFLCGFEYQFQSEGHHFSWGVGVIWAEEREKWEGSHSS